MIYFGFLVVLSPFLPQIISYLIIERLTSTPVTPKAVLIFGVMRNGTFSGTRRVFINVHNFAGVKIDENIVQMPVA